MSAVPDEVLCKECRIVEQGVTVLDGLDDGTGFPPSVRVRRDRAGRWYAAPFFEGDGIAVLNPEGGLFDTLGEAGEGPGEFGRESFPFELGPGDTVHVLEGARHTRFPPVGTPGEAEARLLPLIGYRIVPLRSGQLAISGQLDGRFGVFVVSENGETTTLSGTLRTSPHVPAIATSADGGLWVADTDRFALVRYDTSLTPVDTIIRASDWFPEGHGQPRGAPVFARALPRISAVAEDASGWLWVAVQIPDREWEPLESPPGETSVEELRSRPSDIHDTVVEVISPLAQRVIARSRIDAAFGDFLEGRLVAVKVPNDLGGVSVSVRQLQLTEER